MSAAAEVLRKAADLIEPEGRWSKGYQAHDARGVKVAYDDPSAVCWCAISAIWKNGGGAMVDRFLRKLVPHGVVARWNDAPERTQAEVVSKLREAADLAERRGA